MRITPNQLRSVKIVRVSFSLHRLDRSQKKLQFSDFKKTELEISNVDTYPETVFFLAFLVRTIRPGRTLFPARKCKLDVKIPTNSSLGKLARRTSIKNFSPNIVPIRKNFNTLRSTKFSLQRRLPPTGDIRTEIFNNSSAKCVQLSRTFWRSHQEFSSRRILKLFRAIDIVSFSTPFRLSNGRKNAIHASRAPRNSRPNVPKENETTKGFVNLKLPFFSLRGFPVANCTKIKRELISQNDLRTGH